MEVFKEKYFCMELCVCVVPGRSNSRKINIHNYEAQNSKYSIQCPNVKYVCAHIGGSLDSKVIYKKMRQNEVQEFLERLLSFEDRSNFV